MSRRLFLILLLLNVAVILNSATIVYMLITR